jgi:hypothetical protein
MMQATTSLLAIPPGLLGFPVESICFSHFLLLLCSILSFAIPAAHTGPNADPYPCSSITEPLELENSSS